VPDLVPGGCRSCRLPPRLLDAGGQPPVLVSVLVALAAGVVMNRSQVCPSVEATSGDAIGSQGPELVWTKLAAPVPGAGLLPRAGLLSLLQVSLEAKLCLVAAPAGFGKTILLAQWQAIAGGRRVAWVSLEEGDNDPTRFWSYLVAALRTVEPEVGTVALETLGGPSVELERVVVPSLANDLSANRRRCGAQNRMAMASPSSLTPWTSSRPCWPRWVGRPGLPAVQVSRRRPVGTSGRARAGTRPSRFRTTLGVAAAYGEQPYGGLASFA
jgi:hypothetical protein